MIKSNKVDSIKRVDSTKRVKTKKLKNETILKNQIIDWCIVNNYLPMLINSGRTRGISWNKWWYKTLIVDETLLDLPKKKSRPITKTVNNIEYITNTKGITDLIIIDLSKNISIYVELKSGEQLDAQKKLTVEQKLFRKILIENNIPYIITTSLDNFILQLNNYGN